MPASAQEAGASPLLPARVAIVVGNQDYDNIEDLPNATRDATDMANFLRLYEFRVYEGQNLDRREFETLLREALLNLPLGSEVVFFYAGHGLQVGSRNFLLPTDAVLADPGDLAAHAITLDRVIDALAARASVHVVFVDACRSNPFPGVRLTTDLAATLSETKTGFGPFKSLLNSLVAFSSSPGQVAVDGPADGNSPYTAALMNAISSHPDTDLPLILTDVRQAVLTATSGTQTPWESSTLAQPFVFGLVDDGSFVIAPVPASTGTVVRGAATPGLTARTGFDRMVDLAPAVFDLRGQPLLDAMVTGLPTNGEVAVLDGGRSLFYRPDLHETNAADLTGHRHLDRITLETGPADLRELVTVDLDMPADPCDVQAGAPLDLQGVGLYRLPNEIDVKAALAACRAAVDRNPDTPRFRYQLGRAQQASGDFVAALDSFRAAGAAGHTRSLQAEAYLLITDRIDRTLVPIPLDQARAIALLEQGITAGDPYAIHSRGLRLLRDGATAQDRQRGFDLLDRAAELGHTYSMNELGYYFLDKDSDHYQPARGMTYLQASLDRNDIYGMQNLALVALNGLDGKEPDLALAASLFEKAAAGGHPKAPAALGRMVMRGQLGAKDAARAVAYYDLGLARGDGWGGANAADVILDGTVAGLTAGDAAARAAKAALLPDAKAAERADTILAGLPRKALDAGLQLILNELGEALVVDGAAGPATLDILKARADAADLRTAGDTPRDRLILAARLYWQARPTRPDLY